MLFVVEMVMCLMAIAFVLSILAHHPKEVGTAMGVVEEEEETDLEVGDVLETVQPVLRDTSCKYPVYRPPVHGRMSRYVRILYTSFAKLLCIPSWQCLKTA